MKCPQCLKEGKKSTISIGPRMTTLVCCHPYYDEDGNLIYPDDPNTTRTSYICSNGHKWTEET